MQLSSDITFPFTRDHEIFLETLNSSFLAAIQWLHSNDNSKSCVKKALCDKKPIIVSSERVWDIQNEQKAPKSLAISDAKLIKTNTFLNCTTISSVCLNTTLNYSRPWQESIMVHIYLGENRDVLLLLIIEKRRFTVLVWNIVLFVKCISPYLASVLLGQRSQIRIAYM